MRRKWVAVAGAGVLWFVGWLVWGRITRRRLAAMLRPSPEW